MTSPIPVQNIYYLLIYSWNSLAEGEIADVSKLESNELVDLFAAVLYSGINRLLRRGLDQSYIDHEEEIAGVRGRINIGITARPMLASHGRAYCEFDELSVDSLQNQILLATVLSLRDSPKLDPKLQGELTTVIGQLGVISRIHLSKFAFRRVQLHGNNRVYRFLLRICELVMDMSLFSERNGSHQFRDFIRDEKRMARLFENFVFNFYKTHRPDLSIHSDQVAWVANSSSDPELRFLPQMRTDISVRDSRLDTSLVIDTKFYRETFQKYYDKETIHSSHLYQLYAYLKNLEEREGSDRDASGMLLYPVTERPVSLEYEFPGHRIQICTLNLANDWQEVHNELLELLSPSPPEIAE